MPADGEGFWQEGASTNLERLAAGRLKWASAFPVIAAMCRYGSGTAGTAGIAKVSFFLFLAVPLIFVVKAAGAYNAVT